MSEFCLISGDWGEFWIPNLAQMSLIECYWMLQNSSVNLIYPRLLTGFGILFVFTNLNFIEFQVRYLALFFLLAVIDGFRWFWMGVLTRISS